MKKIKSIIFSGILFITSFSACRKAGEIPFNDSLEANFTYAISGDTTFFTNTSTGISTYVWDFGDGATSTEINPIHVYAGKGEYLVTLSGDGAEANTIVTIDKSSPVKLDDGTLDDWATVTTNVITSGPDGGVALSGKLDYDGNYVYIYIEQATTLADNTIVSVWFNTDNDNVSGFYNGAFPGLGIDNYYEGQLLQDEGSRWLDAYSFSGGDDHAGWNWEYKDYGQFWVMGYYEEDAGVTKYEYALDRNKFPGLKNQSVTVGISILDADWSDIGYLPDGGTPGYELNLNE